MSTERARPRPLADTLSGMAQPDELETRVAALETQVRDLAERVRTSNQDAAAARVLAGGADRDVAEIRGEIREFRTQNTRVLNAMREDLNTVREDQNAMREDLNAVRADLTDLRTSVDIGFTEIRGRLDATAAGMQQVVTLLNGLIAQRGGASGDE